MDTNSESVMIVDDVAANLRLLSDILKDTSYQIRPFSRPESALNSALIDPPDILLLDVNMPILDGFEFCQRIRQNPATEQIPIIFISASQDSEDVVKGLRLGANDYITKPFHDEEVLSRIQTHLQLQRYQKSLRLKNEALEETLQKLHDTQAQLIHAEKMASLGTLAAGIAHEINNPINFVRANSQILRKRIASIESGQRAFDAKESETWQSLIDGFQDGSDRIIEIVQSLETYARVDRDGVSLFDPVANVKATLTMLNHKLGHGIELTTAIESPLMPLLANVGQINQVITNLVSNAIDAVREKEGSLGQISISGSTVFEGEKASYRIQISDNGKGIPSEFQKRIFEPFFTTKEPGKGTGLGLSIVSSILRRHDSEIRVTSDTEGTSFEFELPH